MSSNHSPPVNLEYMWGSNMKQAQSNSTQMINTNLNIASHSGELKNGEMIPQVMMWKESPEEMHDYWGSRRYIEGETHPKKDRATAINCVFVFLHSIYSANRYTMEGWLDTYKAAGIVNPPTGKLISFPTVKIKNILDKILPLDVKKLITEKNTDASDLFCFITSSSFLEIVLNNKKLIEDTWRSPLSEC